MTPAQAAEINAAGLAPTNNLESAIAATLAPGLYTALLAGLNNRTGIGVVEVCDRGNGIPNPTPTLPPFPSPTPPSPPTPTPSPGVTPSPTASATVTPASGNADPDRTGKHRMYSELRWSDRASPALGMGGDWVTSTIDPDSAPNDAFTPNPATISESFLFSPNISINSASAVIHFRNNFNTDYDPPPAQHFGMGMCWKFPPMGERSIPTSLMRVEYL